MAHLIADLLHIPNQPFTNLLARWESVCANPSVDVRLVAEIRQSQLQTLKALGLDPKDSYELEIYHALLGTTELHDRIFRNLLDIEIGLNDEIESKVVNLVNRLAIDKTIWAVKPSHIKRLLTQHPPKKLLKHLGFQTVESMIKRQPIGLIAALAAETETNQWLVKYQQKLAKLTPLDFESKKIKINVVESDKWTSLAAEHTKYTGTNIISAFEVGEIYLSKTSQQLPGMALGLAVFLIQELASHVEISRYLELNRNHLNFGQRLSGVIHKNNLPVFNLVDQKLEWKDIFRHLESYQLDYQSDINQQYIDSTSISVWEQFLGTLVRLEPALDFWTKIDFVGLSWHQSPISFNLTDNLINLINNLEFNNRHMSNMQFQLWQKLVGNYLEFKPLKTQLQIQADNHFQLGVANAEELFA